MSTVVRAFLLYGFLLLVFRIVGKRSLAEITTFDLILLLLIGEAAQQALLGEDFSVVNSVIAISALSGLDLALTSLKQRFGTMEKWLDGVPLVLVADGKLLEDRMRKEGVGVDDIMAAARAAHGLERADQIKYAVLERGGAISIIPRGSVG